MNGHLTKLQAEDVTVRIGGMTVLDQVSATARAGGMLALVGPSGSGKTTLLHVLAGLQPADQGRVLADGQPVAMTGNRPSWTGGLILQTYGLSPLLSAAENVALPLQVQRRKRHAIYQAVSDVLAVLGLEEVADQLASDLSGGEQQRTAVARALVTDPPVVLADEPSSALDGPWHEVVMRLLTEQAAKGAVVVVATHDEDVIARCTDVLTLGGE